ncbi:MAG: hypothetical protein ACJAXQ_001720 [Parvibaculaceae bacterium]|jgi:hypothetical protein
MPFASTSLPAGRHPKGLVLAILGAQAAAKAKLNTAHRVYFRPKRRQLPWHPCPTSSDRA